MQYVSLGRSGLVVSRLGFGGAPAGLANYVGRYDPASPAERRGVILALQRAVELGITYFDTAPGYGNGIGESIFGEALAGAGDRVFIATKVGLWESSIRRSVEQSLVRLKRGCLDLIQIHGTSYTDEQADRVLRAGGVLDELQQLREQGLVRLIGFTSEDSNPPVYRFVQSGRFDVMQIAYNLIFQHPHEPSRPFGVMVEAEQQKMGIVTMRTATSGIFQRWVRMVNPSDDHDYTPDLIRFVLSNALVDVALVGMRTAREVEQNVAVEADTAARIDLAALHHRFV
jgi:hypothetical protein